MMMPANFSAVAENELTYVVGGASLVDVLADPMKTANWKAVNTNLIMMVGNTYLKSFVGSALSSMFDGNYVPGDVIGGAFKQVANGYNTGYKTLDNNAWGFALGVLNAGMQVVGGLSAIYALGNGSIGIDVKSISADASTKGYYTQPAEFAGFQV